MDYQPKTTMINISVGDWTEASKCSPTSQLHAAHAVAMKIAQLCQMDIMSFTPYTKDGAEDDNSATAVYVNNGRSLDDIVRIMQSEIENKPKWYWMIIEVEKWQGMIDCAVATRGTGESWDQTSH